MSQKIARPQTSAASTIHAEASVELLRQPFNDIGSELGILVANFSRFLCTPGSSAKSHATAFTGS